MASGEVMAFGDSLTDRELFGLSGFAVAINSAVPELESQVDLDFRGDDLSLVIEHLPL